MLPPLHCSKQTVTGKCHKHYQFCNTTTTQPSQHKTQDLQEHISQKKNTIKQVDPQLEYLHSLGYTREPTSLPLVQLSPYIAVKQGNHRRVRKTTAITDFNIYIVSYQLGHIIHIIIHQKCSLPFLLSASAQECCVIHK